MKIQHLVLDDDVHKALKARKKKIGVTVKEIGNSALRAALAMPTMEELIVEKLVETGKISRKDYDQAVAAADKAIKTASKKAAEAIIRDASRPTQTLGSWEGREVYRSPDGELQVFDHWARDAKKTPSPEIVHEESHAWSIVVSGKVHVRIGDEEATLGPNEAVPVPPGTPVVSTPLTKSARLLLVLAPASDLDKR
jgi:mannose-6-phosphate isomerase-like protein (cupin superfamily)